VPEAPRVIASRQGSWFEVLLRDDGIIVYRAHAGFEVTRDDAWEILQLGLEITTTPRRTLVLMQDVARVDREARELFASDAFLSLTHQTALVVGSPVSRVIGNFFVGLNRLKYPVRVFDDPKRALAWLNLGTHAELLEFQFDATPKPSST
jgi:hypothetical protein